MHGSVGDQKQIDFVLSKQLQSSALADIDEFSPRRNQTKHFPAHQRVVQHNIRPLQKAERFDGQQLRIARARTDKEDFAHYSTPSVEGLRADSCRKRSNLSRLARLCRTSFVCAGAAPEARSASRAAPSHSIQL